MKNELEFGEKYFEYVSNLNKFYEEKSIFLKKEGRDDDSVHERIKANIAGILCGMLTSAQDKILNGQFMNKRFPFADILEKYSEQDERLYYVYLAYIDMLRRPSMNKLSEAEQHDDFEGVMIEKIKLEVLECCENEFMKLFSERRSA